MGALVVPDRKARGRVCAVRSHRCYPRDKPVTVGKPRIRRLMEIGPLLPLFRRRWWILVAVAGAAGVLGWVVASGIPPSYSATTTLLVGPVNGDANTLRGSSLQVATYADLATSSSVLDAVSRETGVNLAAGDGPGVVRATGNDTTRLLSLRVELPNPADAVRVVGSIAQRMIALSAGSAALAEGQIQVMDAASSAVLAPPRTTIIALLAAVAGLVAAALAIVGLEALSPAVRSDGEAERMAEAPVLVAIQHSQVARRGRASTALAPMHPDYALLAAHLLARDSATSALVVSSGRKEGTGEVVLDVARAIAATGRSVSIIADDPAAAPVNDALSAIVSRAGISEDGPSKRRELRLGSVPGVFIAVGGPISEAPQRTRQSPQQQIANAAGGGRFVLIDGGAVDGSTPATRWCEGVTSTVMVVRIGTTDRQSLSAAVRALRAAGAARLDLVTFGFVAGKRPSFWAVAGREGRAGMDTPSLALTDDSKSAVERSLGNRPPATPE